MDLEKVATDDERVPVVDGVVPDKKQGESASLPHHGYSTDDSNISIREVSPPAKKGVLVSQEEARWHLEGSEAGGQGKVRRAGKEYGSEVQSIIERFDRNALLSSGENSPPLTPKGLSPRDLSPRSRSRPPQNTPGRAIGSSTPGSANARSPVATRETPQPETGSKLFESPRKNRANVRSLSLTLVDSNSTPSTPSKLALTTTRDPLPSPLRLSATGSLTPRRQQSLDLSALASPKKRATKAIAALQSAASPSAARKKTAPVFDFEDIVAEGASSDFRPDSGAVDDVNSPALENEPQMQSNVVVDESLTGDLALSSGNFSGVKSSVVSAQESQDIVEEIPADTDLPLHSAVSYSYVSDEYVEKLLAEGHDPNLQDPQGLTPMHQAVLYSYLIGVHTLIKYKASLEIPDINGRTPLFSCCSCGEYSEIMMKSLIELGARTDVRDSHGNTLLHFSALCGLYDCVEHLLSSASLINLIDEGNADGDTALHLAARYGHHYCVQVLLQYNANPHVLNKSGHTPSIEAMLGGHIEALSWLQQAEALVAITPTLALLGGPSSTATSSPSHPLDPSDASPSVSANFGPQSISSASKASDKNEVGVEIPSATMQSAEMQQSSAPSPVEHEGSPQEKPQVLITMREIPDVELNAGGISHGYDVSEGSGANEGQMSTSIDANGSGISLLTDEDEEEVEQRLRRSSVAARTGLLESEWIMEDNEQSDAVALIHEIEYALVHASVNAFSRDASEDTTKSSGDGSSSEDLAKATGIRDALRKLKNLFGILLKQDQRRRSRAQSLAALSSEAAAQDGQLEFLKKELKDAKEELNKAYATLTEERNQRQIEKRRSNETDVEARITALERELQQLRENETHQLRSYMALEASYRLATSNAAALESQQKDLEDALRLEKQKVEDQEKNWKYRVEQQVAQTHFLQTELEKLWALGTYSEDSIQTKGAENHAFLTGSEQEYQKTSRSSEGFAFSTTEQMADRQEGSEGEKHSAYPERPSAVQSSAYKVDFPASVMDILPDKHKSHLFLKAEQSNESKFTRDQSWSSPNDANGAHQSYGGNQGSVAGVTGNDLLSSNAATPLPPSSVISSAWIQYQTEDGQPYYYNSETQAVQWASPSWPTENEQEANELTFKGFEPPSWGSAATEIGATTGPSIMDGDDSFSLEQQQKIGEVWNKFFENATMEAERRKSASEIEAEQQKAMAIQLLGAALEGNDERVEDALGQGADPTLIQDSQGRSAAHIAQRWANAPLRKYIASCEKGHASILAMLSDYGADMNAVDHLGNTPLHVASLFGNEDCVQILLESAAQVNVANKMEDTSLHLAVWKANLGCVLKLLEYGADAMRTNIYNQTPYSNVMTRSPVRHHLGTMKPDSSMVKVLKYLESIGAGGIMLSNGAQSSAEMTESEDEERESIDEDDSETELRAQTPEKHVKWDKKLLLDENLGPETSGSAKWNLWGVSKAVSAIGRWVTPLKAQTGEEYNEASVKNDRQNENRFHYDYENNLWVIDGDGENKERQSASAPPTDNDLLFVDATDETTDGSTNVIEPLVPPPEVLEAMERIRKRQNANLTGQKSADQDSTLSNLRVGNLNRNRFSLTSSQSPSSVRSRYVDTFNAKHLPAGSISASTTSASSRAASTTSKRIPSVTSSTSTAALQL